MTELEKEIESKLRKTVENRGGVCLKWVCPGWSGVPDRIILLPGGRIYFVETKRPKGGRLDKIQKWWKERLERMGFWVFIAWDVEDIAWIELTILSETREREERK